MKKFLTVALVGLALVGCKEMPDLDRDDYPKTVAGFRLYLYDKCMVNAYQSSSYYHTQVKACTEHSKSFSDAEIQTKREGTVAPSQ